MKFKQKVSSGFLFFLIIVPLLFSSRCKKITKPDITIWHAFSPGGQEEKVLLDLIKDYKELSAKKVKAIFIPFDAFNDKLDATLPRDMGPDCFILGADRLPNFEQKNFLEPLDFWLSKEDKNKFFPKAIKTLSIYGSTYGLPLSVETHILYYNSKFVPKAPRTMTELIKISKKIIASKKLKGVLPFLYPSDDFNYHMIWYFHFGAEIFKPGTSIPVLNSPESVNALYYRWSLSNIYNIMPKVVSYSDMKKGLIAQNVPFAISGPWLEADTSKNKAIKVAPIPIIKGNKRNNSYYGVKAIYLSARARQKKETFKFMQFLTSHKSALRFALKGSHIPVRKSVYKETALKTAKYKAFLKQQENSKILPKKVELKVVWTPMRNAIVKALNIKNNFTKEQLKNKKTRAKMKSKIKLKIKSILDQAQDEIENALNKKKS